MRKILMMMITAVCFSILLLQGYYSSAQDIMISPGGTLSVEKENSPAGERFPNLIDNNSGTKFLVFINSSLQLPLWIQFVANEPVVIGQYTLTSANDAAARDPRDWKLEGSNDGLTWKPIDQRKDEVFDSRLQTKTYAIETNTGAFKFLRLTIIKNNGATLFQLAEWRLFKAVPPKAPSALTAVSVSGVDVRLTWTDESNNETGFIVERSKDNVTFTAIATLAANKTEYFDEDKTIRPNTQFFYRVRSTNGFGESENSNVASVTTLDLKAELTDLTDNGGVFTSEWSNKDDDGNALNNNAFIDNDNTTMYQVYDPYPQAFWVKYESAVPAILKRYAFYSGNIASRDFNGWTLEGSNDDTNWTLLDTRSNIYFPDRKRSFDITNNTTAFKYYRLNVVKNTRDLYWAGTMNEWELFGIHQDPVPALLSNLTATALSATSIKLTWQDNATTETGYKVDRSRNNIDFTNIQTVGVNGTEFTDSDVDLKPRTVYYYRVQAKGPEANFGTIYSYASAAIGDNTPPTLNEIPDKRVCAATEDSTFTIKLNGITPGTEPWQKVTLSVSSDKKELFKVLKVTQPVNDTARITFIAEIPAGESASITVTVKDDGGALNNGKDVFSRTFNVIPFHVAFEADYGTPGAKSIVVPRGRIIQLTASGADTYLWNTGPDIVSTDLASNSITVHPDQNFYYSLIATNSQGCIKETGMQIELEKGYITEASNILTPNNDGKNDTWTIYHINTYPGNEVRVFDTGGRLVYHQKDYKNEWDGTLNGSPLQGVYFYVIDLGSGIPNIKGSLTIVRE